MEKLIDELNFKNCMRLRRDTTRKLFVSTAYIKWEFIIHPKYFDANNIFSHPVIQNLKHKQNMVQDLLRQMKTSLKKQIMDNSVKQKIQQIKCITARNGKKSTVDEHMRKTKLYYNQVGLLMIWVKWTIIIQASDNGNTWWRQSKCLYCNRWTMQ